ncbi:MAG: hypothetical protein IPJ66_01095 [Bacteroidetes bacterium]|nr:hypothetical protein [Bacteroidota bacterium]MBL0065365.1 hypothetical protein [Bacteroidota bacterium]
MKRLFKIFLIIYSLLYTISAYSQSWQWAKQIKNVCQNGPIQIMTSFSDGVNTYVLGYFTDCISIGTDTLQSNGSSDMFIAKYNSFGDIVWVKQFGGDGSDLSSREYASGVIDTISHCIYVAGDFSGSMSLSPSIVLNGPTTFSATFLAKLDLNGNFIWGKKIGNTRNSLLYPYLHNGLLYTTGEVYDTMFIDSYLLTRGEFLARFDSVGNCLWARTVISPNTSAYIQASFIDEDIVLSGIFNRDTLNIDTISLFGKGNYDGFLTRIDSTGKVKWAQQIGSVGFDQIGEVYIDNNKDIYFGGKFEDSLTIDSILLTNTGTDLFLAKLNKDGNIFWLKQGHSTGTNNNIYRLTPFHDSEIVITGSFNASITFGNQNMSTSYNQDMFLARFNDDGLCLGADHFGEANGLCVVSDNSDGLVSIGKFNDTVTLNGIVLNSVGAVADVFIAKHSALTEIHETTERRNNSLLIYANPNQGICNIQVPEEFRGEKSLTLKVYGQNGALLKIISIDPGNDDVDLTIENEAKGIYTAILSNGKKQFTGKIIFE